MFFRSNVHSCPSHSLEALLTVSLGKQSHYHNCSIFTANVKSLVWFRFSTDFFNSLHSLLARNLFTAKSSFSFSFLGFSFLGSVSWHQQQHHHRSWHKLFFTLIVNDQRDKVGGQSKQNFEDYQFGQFGFWPFSRAFDDQTPRKRDTLVGVFTAHCYLPPLVRRLFCLLFASLPFCRFTLSTGIVHEQ